MKNKKGFTLIELIAVLVVLSILIASSVAVFINIRNSVLRKEKNNLITYLETKTTSLQSFIETNTNDIATINNEIDDLQGRVTVLEGGTSGGAN